MLTYSSGDTLSVTRLDDYLKFLTAIFLTLRGKKLMTFVAFLKNNFKIIDFFCLLFGQLLTKLGRRLFQTSGYTGGTVDKVFASYTRGTQFKSSRR